MLKTEEEFQFHSLQASKSPPEYWRNLGSSKTRTKEQEIKGRDLILQKITETTENTAIHKCSIHRWFMP